MSICCQNPTIRIEKILENKRKNTPSYDVSEMVIAISDADNNNRGYNNSNSGSAGGAMIGVLPEEEMTEVIGDVVIVPPSRVPEAPEMPESPVVRAPALIPNAPTFRVPSNPLLPAEYQEILNYNDLQYANGFFRTQIGRFAKVESLFGADTVVTYYGFLIGVGLNYILLQDMGSKNVRSVDFWGIKSVYFYYEENDLRRAMMQSASNVSE